MGEHFTEKKTGVVKKKNRLIKVGRAGKASELDKWEFLKEFRNKVLTAVINSWRKRVRKMKADKRALRGGGRKRVY